MTGLLLKDWKLLKNQGKYFLMVILFVAVILFVNSWEYTSFATSYMTFLITMFTLSTFSYDEYDNGMQFLMALPVSRKSYVQEKYIFGTILAVVSWTISNVMRLVFLRMQAPQEFWSEFMGTEPIFLAVVFIFLGYSLPFMLRYGAEKGRTISYGTLFGVFALIMILLKSGALYAVAPIVDNSIVSGTGILNIAVCVFGILFYIGSYFISLKIMRKKEY